MQKIEIVSPLENFKYFAITIRKLTLHSKSQRH